MNNINNFYSDEGDSNIQWNDSSPSESELNSQWETLTGKANNLMNHERFSEAIYLHKQALSVAQILWTRYKQPHLLANLVNLGFIYRDIGGYQEGIFHVEQALEICKELSYDANPMVAVSLNLLGSFYVCLGDYDKGTPYIEKALEIRQSLNQGDSEGTAISLNDLGNIYFSQGKYETSASYLQQSLEMQQRLRPNGHPHIIIGLNNLSILYRNIGNYDKGIYCCQSALEICRKIYPESNYPDGHSDIAASLNAIGSLFTYKGQYKEAESCHFKALKIQEQIYPNKNAEMLVSLNNIAILYSMTGRYEDSIAFNQQVIDLGHKLFPNGHPLVAISLNILGSIYSNQGKYEKVESYLHQSGKILQNLFKDDHPDMALSLANLGYLYTNQEKYEEADFYYQQALEMQQRLFPSGHPITGKILNGLSCLYSGQYKYDRALDFLNQSLINLQNFYQDDHLDIATCLNNSAMLLFELEEYNKAEHLLKQSLNMMQRLFPSGHPNMALCLNNFGVVSLERKNYNQAKLYFQQVLEICKKFFPDDNLNILKSIRGLAITLVCTDNYKEALSQLQLGLEIENKIQSRTLAASSERDRLHFLNRIKATLNIYFSLINKYFNHNLEAVQIAFTLISQRKAINIAASTALNAAIYGGRYPHLESEFKQLRSLSNQIIKLTISRDENELENQPQKLSVEIINQRLVKVQKEYEELEKLLASQVPEIQLKEDINYRVIASELPKKTTLVEFVRFRTFDFELRESREDRYLAFVIPNQQPEQIVMVDLGEAEPIDNLIKRFRDHIISSETNNNPMGALVSRMKKSEVKLSIEDKASFKPSIQIKTYNSQASSAQELTQLLYLPLSKYLSDTKHLIIAPDSALSLLPFELLPTEENNNTYLIDRYQSIRYITTARDLLRHKQPSLRSAGTPLVMADPDYDLCLSVPNTEETQISSVGVDSNADINSSSTFLKSSDWMAEMKVDKIEKLKRLGSTASLGKAIAQRLKVKPYLEQEAIEPLIRDSKCPSILLIATHGIYLPKDETSEEAETSIDNFNRWHRIQVSNPMMRSMLAFAGANSWITEEQIPEAAGKGWLFAQDVASLDLWANEMTILLACQTGLGDVTTGEGVFGLRSAFASAGAKTVIMSLWSVSEKASVLLMERFFDYLEQGLDKSTALKQAQNYIRNVTIAELRQSDAGMEVLRELTGFEVLTPEHELENSPESQPLSHPKFWGAWICQGE